MLEFKGFIGFSSQLGMFMEGSAAEIFFMTFVESANPKVAESSWWQGGHGHHSRLEGRFHNEILRVF